MRNQAHSSGIRNKCVHMRGPETLETGGAWYGA
jgi:hypothetical protein